MFSGRVQATVVVHGTLGLLACVWSAHLGGSVLHQGEPLGTTRAIALPLGLSLGALAGVVAAWATQRAMTRTRWGRELRGALRDSVLDLRAAQVPALALAAAVGEELFFRGALLPALERSLGLTLAVVVSSVAFGLVHVPGNRRLRAWPVAAAVLGVVFALLTRWTGEVLAAVAAHAVLNHENLRWLLAHRVGARSWR
ncbi:MAG: CPBP family intramembrane metalloprotease [Deltaproteobacteria bacterium]|nr:CPBP family intramembrane metalloprotease [Deltaproteobacteria bacterium]